MLEASSTVDARVSVVLLTFDRPDDVARTVARLRALPERPRLLVVDNGSPAGAGRTLPSAADVDVVRLPRNIGAAARNVGVAHARTPYVALSDDDTWWAPGALAAAADLLDAHPRLAVVTARVLIEPGGRDDPTCVRMAASPLPPDPDLPGRPVLGFMAGASVVRRAAFLEVGGFEPRLFLGAEEALLAIDLAAAGWRLAYVPDVVAHHEPSPRRDTLARRRLLLRNRLWLAWMRRPASSAARATWRTAGMALRAPSLLPAVLDAARGASWALARRRVVPPALEGALRRLEASGQGLGEG